MNLTLVDEWHDGLVRIEKSKISLRPLSVGSRVRIGLLNGSMGEVEIKDADEHFYWLEGELALPPPLAMPIAIALAFARPKMMRRTLQSVVELGVKDITLFRSFYCDKSYEQSGLYKSSTLEQLARVALEQACDTQMPRFHIFKSFKPFLEDSILANYKAESICVAHTNGVPLNRQQALQTNAILFGPERGFSAKEINLMESKNMGLFQFGDRHLRYETAVPYILGHWKCSLSLFS
jgi:RsmE family RNA methyltransferase